MALPVRHYDFSDPHDFGFGTKLSASYNKHHVRTSYGLGLKLFG